MKFQPIHPPREYRVGKDDAVVIKDCGRLTLAPEEQVTLLTGDGKEFDVLRKDWGYYATPSLNARLPEFGLRAALVGSPRNRFYLVLVEAGKEKAFQDYLVYENLEMIAWMDDGETLERFRGLPGKAG